MHTPLLGRVRALAAAPFLVAGLLASAALAAPAGAQQAPVSGGLPVAEAAEQTAESPVETFLAVLDALDRLRAEARADAAPEEPADDAERLGCVEAGNSNDVPRVVADIFLCRLAEAGVDEVEARRIAKEAVMVAQCESRFDPNAVVFGGRYLHQPHWNGNRYSAAGVFQFIRATADKWIDGGYGQVHDPRRNIDAAARLYISNRARGLGGWGDWACAAANDGFKHGSVLPGWPGGPAGFPQWVDQYVP